MSSRRVRTRRSANEWIGPSLDAPDTTFRNWYSTTYLADSNRSWWCTQAGAIHVSKYRQATKSTTPAETLRRWFRQLEDEPGSPSPTTEAAFLDWYRTTRFQSQLTGAPNVPAIRAAFRAEVGRVLDSVDTRTIQQWVGQARREAAPPSVPGAGTDGGARRRAPPATASGPPSVPVESKPPTTSKSGATSDFDVPSYVPNDQPPSKVVDQQCPADAGSECGICQETLRTAPYVCLPCTHGVQHKFHTTCLDTWKQRQTAQGLRFNCPVCQEPLDGWLLRPPPTPLSTPMPLLVAQYQLREAAAKASEIDLDLEQPLCWPPLLAVVEALPPSLRSTAAFWSTPAWPHRTSTTLLTVLQFALRFGRKVSKAQQQTLFALLKRLLALGVGCIVHDLRFGPRRRDGVAPKTTPFMDACELDCSVASAMLQRPDFDVGAAVDTVTTNGRNALDFVLANKNARAREWLLTQLLARGLARTSVDAVYERWFVSEDDLLTDGLATMALLLLNGDPARLADRALKVLRKVDSADDPDDLSAFCFDAPRLRVALAAKGLHGVRAALHVAAKSAAYTPSLLDFLERFVSQVDGTSTAWEADDDGEVWDGAYAVRALLRAPTALKARVGGVVQAICSTFAVAPDTMHVFAKACHGHQWGRSTTQYLARVHGIQYVPPKVAPAAEPEQAKGWFG